MDVQRGNGRDLTDEHRAEIERFARSRMDRRRLVGAAAGGAAALTLGARARRASAARPQARFTPSAVAAAAKVLQTTGDSAEAAVEAAKAVLRDGAVHCLGGRVTGAGPDRLLRTDVGGADRDQDQRH